MSEWKWKTLGDIASSEGYGLVDGPFGSNLPASCYVESGIPVIRGSNLTLGTERFVADEFVYVSEETASRLERSIARPNDIVFTKKGTIGQTGLVPTDLPYEVYLISSNQMKLTVDGSLADPIFVYYYVSSEASQNKIKKDSEFTGVPKTNTKYLREFPIYLPPLQKQHQIASILDSLDRKIENLRKQNETLEAIAQTLFKHWFVDFEFPNEDGKPYKSSGGEMVRSELGEIPLGWYVGKLGELAEISTGKGLKKHEFREDGLYPVLGANGEMGRTDKFLKEEKLILTGRVGTLGIVSLSNSRVWISDNVIIISPARDFFHFIYFCLRNTNLKLLNRGSTQPLITQGDLKELRFVVPDIKRLKNFSLLCLSLFNKIDINQKGQQTLTKTRDVLLPKLMSGKLRVTES